MTVIEDAVARKAASLWPHRDERQRRLVLGAEARELGRGGVKSVAAAAGVLPDTVAKGLRELASGAASTGRVRRPGGGRKPLTATDPGLLAALDTLVDPATRGDPMSALRWTSKSTRTLAGELTAQGHRVSSSTVGQLLRTAGYSLQANIKVREGSAHQDRDAQFHYLNGQVADHQQGQAPVVSVDTKKKELVGDYQNNGQEWMPQGKPERVQVHDFPDPKVGKAIPYGIYDVAANTGWVSVGQDHDTSKFAVATLRRWWTSVGQIAYPAADRLLICADGGGSNGYRVRAWKTELAALATETGLAITVCHLPPGTSKRNKIEHRLFSHISMNWRGRPLISHEVVVDLIGATTARTGLQVHAELDPGIYQTKIKIGDEHMAAIALDRHDFHGEGNYTLHPEPRHAEYDASHLRAGP